jgi:hypothetical protein
MSHPHCLDTRSTGPPAQPNGCCPRVLAGPRQDLAS